ncbi:hypothetical protein L1887_34152 [Cichorium endivia]|nr:hypothetical protein L1887_34152 [Cichorium endivia]
MIFSPLTAFPFGVNVSDEIVTAPIKSKTCHRKRAKIGAEKNVLRFDVAVEDPFQALLVQIHNLTSYSESDTISNAPIEYGFLIQ